MKILLVRPDSSPETIGLQHVMLVEPLELEILAALKRDEDSVVLADLILDRKPLKRFLSDLQPDVVCFTGYITHVNIIKNYCREVKQQNPAGITVVGGVHCEVCPADFDDDAIDFRVVRNAAAVFTGLLHHVDKKATLPSGILRKHEKVREDLPPFDFRIPFPDRSITAGYRHRYFYIFRNKVALIKTSFGCPYTCSFCFCRTITGFRYQQRPMDEVIEELKQIGEKEIYIVDDDFLVDPKRLREFIRLLKQNGLKKHFLVYGRADFIAAQPELMHELRQAGLRTVIVGFESFNEAELKAYDKKTDLTMYRKTMSVLRREKIDCFATIILHPNWGRKEFDQMIRTVKSLGIHFVNLQPLTPLPGTGVSYPPEKLVIGPGEFEKWDLAHVTVKPERLSIANYYREILRAYNRIVFRPSALWKYLVTYPPEMLLKMIAGSGKVSRQYKEKIKQAADA